MHRAQAAEPAVLGLASLLVLGVLDVDPDVPFDPAELLVEESFDSFADSFGAASFPSPDPPLALPFALFTGCRESFR
jgi:hypothetical protein